MIPIDKISVYYRCQPEGEYLDSVVKAHTDFILATIKAPLLPFPVPKTSSVVIEEKTQVCVCFYVLFHMVPAPHSSFLMLCFSLLQLKGSDLELTIIKGCSAPQAPLNGPACTYVNLKVKVTNKEQGSTWGGEEEEKAWSC